MDCSPWGLRESDMTEHTIMAYPEIIHRFLNVQMFVFLFYLLNQ